MTFDNTKSHKKPGFTLPLENTFLEKPQGGGGSNQPPPPPSSCMTFVLGNYMKVVISWKGNENLKRAKWASFWLLGGSFYPFYPHTRENPGYNLIDKHIFTESHLDDELEVRTTISISVRNGKINRQSSSGSDNRPCSWRSYIKRVVT